MINTGSHDEMAGVTQIFLYKCNKFSCDSSMKTNIAHRYALYIAWFISERHRHDSVVYVYRNIGVQRGLRVKREVMQAYEGFDKN